jgi:patatin-like phospholipase/acyl hydrolase
MTMMKVLSIDGGGIRGIIPALILAELEARTHRPVPQLFDLIAGTSTGGILALGLSVPGDSNRPLYSARDLAQLYERDGSKIFDRSIFYRLQTGLGLAGPKYPAKDIEAVLGHYFGDVRLRDALTRVLVTAYEIEQRRVIFFSSEDAKRDSNWDFPMKAVARATSAAPTYFPPERIACGGPTGYLALVDGGVFANNPAMCAYVEARKVRPEADDVLLVSLGTGELTRPFLCEHAEKWGLAEWAPRILDVIFDGVSDTVAYQLKYVLPPRSQPRYYRFQVKLDFGSDDMDDASKGNIHLLQLKAAALIKEADSQLTELCNQLV